MQNTPKMEECGLTDTDGKIAQYKLADQIGHILRKVSQRHSGIFQAAMPDDLTPTRFAALVVLFQQKSLSQNELGRQTAMDAATIKGVVDRLQKRGLLDIKPDPADSRRNLIELTPQGIDLVTAAIPIGSDISKQTLAPLSAKEQRRLIELLVKII